MYKEIVILGRRQQGKTTLALGLASIFKANGFAVTIATASPQQANNMNKTHNTHLFKSVVNLRPNVGDNERIIYDGFVPDHLGVGTPYQLVTLSEPNA